MTWLVWRQHRVQLAVVVVLVCAAALVLFLTAMRARDFAQANGLSSCTSDIPRDRQCQLALNRFVQRFGTWTSYASWTSFLAILIAIFVGAPLIAREVEHGTHRLVWSQSVPRGRWLFMKLWPLVLAAAAVGAVQGLAFLLWWGNFDVADHPRMARWSFDVQGIVPIGYALFALAVGIAAGAFVQRTIAAMAIAAAAFFAVRFLVAQFVREHYMAPVVDHSQFFDSPQRINDDWIVRQVVIDRDGRELQVINCGQSTPEQCSQTLGLTAVTEYQPADRFWVFQGIELALFLALTAALLAATWCRIRGRGFAVARRRFPGAVTSAAHR